MLTVRALNADIKKALRTDQHQAYEDVTLLEVARRVADRHGYGILGGGTGGMASVQLSRVSQDDEDDLAFLKRLAEPYGYVFKVTADNLVFHAVRDLELTPGVIGVIFSLGAVGSMSAALTATRISRRFGIGPTTIVVAALFGPAMLLVAFAPEGNAAVPFFVAAQLLFGFTVVVYNIVQVSYRQAICPPRLQGRMNSVMRFIVWGTMPIGALVGGALGTWLGLRETIVIGAIGDGLALLWIVFSPQRHLREMPEPVEDDAAPEPVPA